MIAQQDDICLIQTDDVIIQISDLAINHSCIQILNAIHILIRSSG
jgi:hypothetical protein